MARTRSPAGDPRKYSTQAQESKVFMPISLVPKSPRGQPGVRAEERAALGEQSGREKSVNLLGESARPDLPYQVVLHILPEENGRLDGHCVYVYVNVYINVFRCLSATHHDGQHVLVGQDVVQP